LLSYFLLLYYVCYLFILAFSFFTPSPPSHLTTPSLLLPFPSPLPSHPSPFHPNPQPFFFFFFFFSF
jgi:hypothetical protein